jgi:hypothetical protein
MRLSLVIGVASLLAAIPALSKPAAKKAAPSACVECHTRVTPGIVTQHSGSAHAKSGEVDCSTCHGSAHGAMDDAAKAVMPSPATCKQCHEEQVARYAAGKHSLAWVAMDAMPGLTHQPVPVKGAGMKGCSGCHKIGEKDASKAGVHYGTGACDSCHTRHSFSKAEARDPRACQTCHMGFDHPQWEMWSGSKHGTVWQVEGGKGGRAPTCQDCHMQGGDHRAMTAWGFLAVRLPEDDPEWMADRVEILKAVGVLDKAGQPTGRLDVVKAGKVARLSKEEFQAERSKMEKTCAKCHSPSYAKEQLAAGDRMVRESDRVLAAAIREVRALYDEGVLAVPAGWTTAPDLLQFQDAKSPIELDLYKMFMEYRMRAFQGAFHNNPDYTQWYGWAPLVETLTRVKAEASRLRAEHRAPGKK